MDLESALVLVDGSETDDDLEVIADIISSNEEIFALGDMRFDIEKAMKLYGNKKPSVEKPTKEWILPLIKIDPEHAKTVDITKPVIFGTVEMGGQVGQLLIDGYHRVTKALNENEKIPVIILNQEETENIML